MVLLESTEASPLSLGSILTITAFIFNGKDFDLALIRKHFCL